MFSGSREDAEEIWQMISVVVPLYNYACYIAENIQSVQRQTFKDWEIIIVDDCSKDDPYKVIKPYLFLFPVHK